MAIQTVRHLFSKRSVVEASENMQLHKGEGSVTEVSGLFFQSFLSGLTLLFLDMVWPESIDLYRSMKIHHAFGSVPVIWATDNGHPYKVHSGRSEYEENPVIFFYEGI